MFYFVLFCLGAFLHSTVQKSPVSFLMKGHLSSTPVGRGAQRHMVLGSCPGSSQRPHMYPSPWPLHHSVHSHLISDPGLVSISTQSPLLSASPSAGRPSLGRSRYRLHWHCLFPFHFSSSPPMSPLYMGHFPSPGPFLVSSSSCVLRFTAVAFWARRFGDPTHHRPSSPPGHSSLFLWCF